MPVGAAFEYRGPGGLEQPIAAALARVVDPEMALNIVSLGLVYGVDAREDGVKVRLTMTSAACPVAEVIIDDVKRELAAALGAPVGIEVELVWEPPWTPDRMSHSARRAMGWE